MEKVKKILIVEDEIALITALSDKLTNEGYDVIKAMDGKEGLKSAILERPDIVLLDINLPVMDGITMLKELRKDEFGKSVEVVMLTNFNEYKLLADALAQGAHDYIVKSDWKLEDIVKLVSDKLK